MHGIHQPRILIDGTVRWEMSCASSIVKPSTVLATLEDPKWADAMNAEYNALLQNKTWHLVQAPKGKISSVANGYTKSRRRLMDLLLGIKQDSWRKGINKDMGWTMRIH